jgi:hypothetical protein
LPEAKAGYYPQIPLFEKLSGTDIKKYPKLRKLRMFIEKIMINTD